MRYWLLTLYVVCLAAGASADDAKNIFTRISPSTVSIKDDEGGSGSGIIVAVDKDAAYILTCYHVIEGVTKLFVGYDADGKKVVYVDAVVTKRDKEHDLALVRAPNPQRRLPVFVSDTDPDLYDELYVVASPFGLQRQSSIERLNTKDAGKWWSMTGIAIPGMSGSGVVDGRAEIVCVLRAMFADGDDAYTQMGICVPLPFIRAFLKGAIK